VSDDESSRRLLRLEQILAADFVAGSTGTGRTGPSNTALDRIIRLTGQLQGRAGFEQDAVDLLSNRLLLNEYVSVLADLRALAALAEEHLEKALSSLKDRRCARARRLLEGAQRKSDSNSPINGGAGQS
jgi:hypothetical protein